MLVYFSGCRGGHSVRYLFNYVILYLQLVMKIEKAEYLEVDARQKLNKPIEEVSNKELRILQMERTLNIF